MVNKSFDKNARRQTETDEDDDLGEPIRNARELEMFIAAQSKETQRAIHKFVAFLLRYTGLRQMKEQAEENRQKAKGKLPRINWKLWNRRYDNENDMTGTKQPEWPGKTIIFHMFSFSARNKKKAQKQPARKMRWKGRKRA